MYLLHEVVDETMLGEMRCLLAPVGLALLVDRRGDVGGAGELGPPMEVTFSAETGLERCCTLQYCSVR